MKRVHFLGKTFLVRVAWVHFLKHDLSFLWGLTCYRHDTTKRAAPIGGCGSLNSLRCGKGLKRFNIHNRMPKDQYLIFRLFHTSS